MLTQKNIALGLELAQTAVESLPDICLRMRYAMLSLRRSLEVSLGRTWAESFESSMRRWIAAIWIFMTNQ